MIHKNPDIVQSIRGSCLFCLFNMTSPKQLLNKKRTQDKRGYKNYIFTSNKNVIVIYSLMLLCLIGAGTRRKAGRSVYCWYDSAPWPTDGARWSHYCPG